MVLGLTEAIRGCLFDMDGVLTRTADVHTAAWQQMFDEFLRDRSAKQGNDFRAFDPVADYNEYVDGKPRLDGARAFLHSRGIDLPDGAADDPPGTWTVHGLSNRKNDLVLAKLKQDGVAVYDGSLRYLRAVREAGLKCAVVSSSEHTRQVLDAAGITGMFDARVDGTTAAHDHLPGKPAPDMFLAGAAAVHLPAAACAVFEDATAGVEAGHAGGFGLVVGVDRVGHADQLRAHGADVVVADLAELLDRR
ncbi:HAD family phosphatase [Nocardia sp. BMG111209]|uniref:HAD family hydrolase n=1 Tax=Nocardia sp. BMG111209 TaxID=1160137 RepID=UPI0003A3BE13|nr:beta-phosphoglucomutase family hydrolase [Nocardia sp. BMG111209]